MLDIIRDILAVLGGVGIVIIGLSKFFGGVLRDYFKEKNRKGTELDVESHRNRLASRRIQADRFLTSQYDVYVELWKSLQGLRLAVDALWQKANQSNIAGLANQLRHMRSQFNDWSLFFEERHLNELNRLLNVLENFESGKTRLTRIRASENITGCFKDDIEHQVEQNRNYKEEFEQAIEQMRVSFQERLSKIEDENRSD